MDCATRAGWLPLHAAAFNGHTDAIRALLGAGAGVDQPSEAFDQVKSQGWKEDYTMDFDVDGMDGWTALHCAASNGHVDAMQALLSSGADVAVESRKAGTALHVAAGSVVAAGSGDTKPAGVGSADAIKL